MRFILLIALFASSLLYSCKPGEKPAPVPVISSEDSAALCSYLNRNKSVGDYTKGLEMALLLRDLSASAGNADDELEALHVLFELYFDNGDNDKALEVAQRAIDLNDTVTDLSLKARSFHIMGRYLVRKRNATLASRNLSTAFRAYRDLGDTLRESNVFRDMVRSYNLNCMFDSSRINIARCLMFDSIIGNSCGIAEDIALKGAMYIEMFKADLVSPDLKLLDSAEIYFAMARELDSKLPEKSIYVDETLSLGYSDLYFYKLSYAAPEPSAKTKYIDSALAFGSQAMDYVLIMADADLRKHYSLQALQLKMMRGQYSEWRPYYDSLVAMLKDKEASYIDKEIACRAQAMECESNGDYQRAMKLVARAETYSDAYAAQNNSLAITVGIAKGQYEGEMARNKAKQMQMEGEARAMVARLITMSVLAVLLIVFGVYVSRSLRKEKRYVTRIKEYNAEIVAAHEAIMNQSIAITDSISYANLIQQAAMTSRNDMFEIFGENLVFFRPKDIVSGDFFWAQEIGRYKLVVAGDCTGHGVPGALLSMLGMSILDYVTRNFGSDDYNQAYKILDKMRLYFKRTLNQTVFGEGQAMDSMDMALLVFDTEAKQLHYSAAFRPLVYFRDGELKKIKGDPMPIGVYPKERDHFSEHVIDIVPGDVFYIFSDGIVDQDGYENAEAVFPKAFSSKRFLGKLSEIYKLPFEEQKQIIADAVDSWSRPKGASQKKCDQTDDNVIIGIAVDNFISFG